VVGECTREILAELGYDDAEIDNLAEKGVVTESASQRPAH
jgi:crotonobetainyl-CoA:carnitine CoA-transferase CaiB-like acyl-CoA transferase